jgi:hypothetical protein
MFVYYFLARSQYSTLLQQPLDSLYHQINSRDIDLQVTKEFKMDGIFNGAAVIVKVRAMLLALQICERLLLSLECKG